MMGLLIVLASCAKDSNKPGNTTPVDNLVAPGAPGIATVTSADSQLTISWNAVEGAAAYEVWYSGTDDPATAKQNGADIADTESLITGLANGTTYYIWLKAKNTAGKSGFGTMASGIPTALKVAPAAPGAATVTPADNQLKLSWNAVEGATAYEVWYSETDDPATAKQNGGDISETRSLITGLANVTTYYVWLKAKNTAGKSGFGAIASGITTAVDTTPPAKARLAGITSSDTQIVFTWIDPADGDFDHAVISIDTMPLQSQTIAKGIQTCTFTGLAVNTKFTIIIKAADIKGNLSEPVMLIMTTTSSGTIKVLPVYTAADLNAVRGGIAGYETWGLDKHYILMAEIDLKDISTASGWAPIGDNSSSDDTTRFTGTFNGNGFVIKNMNINSAASDYQGLFGYIGTGGKVENIGLADNDVKGQEKNGGLVGYNDGGTVTFCYVTGTVTGTYYTGSLVGYNDGGTVSSCYATGAVTGTCYTGSLVGYNDGGTVSGCYATGSVSVTGDFNGGLVGYNDGGTVSGCYATGAVTGSNNIGGLVGLNGGTVTFCYASGTVTGACYTGGQIGYNGGTVSNCYATGSVTGTGDFNGGLVGVNSGTVSNCYATGSVTGTGNYNGGLVGVKESGIISTSYFSDSHNNGIGTYITPAENMKIQSTFTGFDFTGTPPVWVISDTINNGYPYLLNNPPE